MKVFVPSRGLSYLNAEFETFENNATEFSSPHGDSLI